MTKTRDLANLIADSKVGPSEIDTTGTYNMNALQVGGTTVIDSSRAVTANGLTVDGLQTINTSSSGVQPLLTLLQTNNTVGNTWGIDFKRTTSSASEDLVAKIHANREGGDATGITFSVNKSNGTFIEAARFDSSGNWLVGKTTGGVSTDGFQANAAGYATITDTSFSPLILNRKTSDGTILDLQKNGISVGTVGVAGTELGTGAGDANLLFMPNDDAIAPASTSSGGASNGALDLGRSARRFKDLYLSGGIEIENGTGNVGVGKQALNSNTGSYNTALGYQAGYSQTTGGNNIKIGPYAGYLGNGNQNCFIGRSAGYNSTGSNNTFVGRSPTDGAGGAMTTGSKNTIIGGYDGNQYNQDIRTVSNNIVLSDGDGKPMVRYRSLDSSGSTRGWMEQKRFSESDYAFLTSWVFANSAFSNPVTNLVTFDVTGRGSYPIILVRVTVYQKTWSVYNGNVHVGSATAGVHSAVNQLDTRVGTMEVLPGQVGLTTGVGSLAWSGSNTDASRTLQYTPNRQSNYDNYDILVEVSYRGGGAVGSCITFP